MKVVAPSNHGGTHGNVNHAAKFGAFKDRHVSLVLGENVNVCAHSHGTHGEILPVNRGLADQFATHWQVESVVA